MKNRTLRDLTQYVHYLSTTEGGWQHGKKLADEYALHLPAGSVLRQDLGLLGHALTGLVVAAEAENDLLAVIL